MFLGGLDLGLISALMLVGFESLEVVVGVVLLFELDESLREDTLEYVDEGGWVVIAGESETVLRG